MVNKDEITNSFRVLADKVDERYLDLTLKQWGELKANINQAWAIIERRKQDRRA